MPFGPGHGSRCPRSPCLSILCLSLGSCTSVATQPPSWAAPRRSGQQRRESPALESCPELASLLRKPFWSLAEVHKAILPNLTGWRETPKLATGVLVSLAEQRKAYLAVQVLQCLHGGHVNLDVLHCNMVMNACAKSSEWEVAALLLQGSMARMEVAPDAISLNSAISACKNGGEWQQALALLDASRQLRVAPNAISCLVAIGACERTAQWQAAVALLDAMPGLRVSPAELCFNAAMSVCEKAAQWQAGLALLGKMLGLRFAPDVQSYSAVIAACGRNEQWQLALMLFDTLPAARVEVDVASTGLAAVTAAEGNFSLPERQFAPDVVSCNSALSACERGGQWERALALFFDAMPQLRLAPSVFSFSILMSSCIQRDQWQRALSLFQAMPSYGLRPSQVSYNFILDAVFDRPLGHHVFLEALDNEVYPLLEWDDYYSKVLDLHELSYGAAILATSWWLLRRAKYGIHKTVLVITGKGATRGDPDGIVVRPAVERLLKEIGLFPRAKKRKGLFILRTQDLRLKLGLKSNPRFLSS